LEIHQIIFQARKIWLILRQLWDLFYNHNPRKLRKFIFIENIDLIEFIERENIVEEKFVIIHSSFLI
jgi:hypothetical protein